jgi:hypothetical protein
VKTPPQTPGKASASPAVLNFIQSAQGSGMLHTPSKKRTSASSNLDETVWRLLDFANTLAEGIRRMLMWPIITTIGVDKRRMYLSYL